MSSYNGGQKSRRKVPLLIANENILSINTASVEKLGSADLIDLSPIKATSYKQSFKNESQKNLYI
jgi:hypothetical protein